MYGSMPLLLILPEGHPVSDSLLPPDVPTETVLQEEGIRMIPEGG